MGNDGDVPHVRRGTALGPTSGTDGGRRWRAAERTTAIQAKASTPGGCTGRGETSQRLGFAGGCSTAADCGGGNRRREKGETATARRETDSGELEHLRDSGNPLLALDWAELRRARPATSGRYRARAATAALFSPPGHPFYHLQYYLLPPPLAFTLDEAMADDNSGGNLRARKERVREATADGGRRRRLVGVQGNGGRR